MTKVSENLRIAFAGGGTGGHLYPALNIAAGLKKQWKTEFLFFGTSRGLEDSKVPEYGYRLVRIPVAGFHRRITPKNLSFPFKLWASLRKCRKELKEFNPHLVIGTGGYVMGPVLRTAHKMNIPIVMQEQNSFPGLTTRILAKHAEIIFLGYEDARTYLPDAKKMIVTGNPINTTLVFTEKEEVRKEFQLKEELRTLFVFGGSQGSQSINQALERILLQKKLPDDVQVLWQTGTGQYGYYKEFIEKNQIQNVILKPFIDDMYKAYHIADMAVCRAGAMTLTELIYAGVPAILIPLPGAAGNHQFKNAASLRDRDAAVIVEENDGMDKQIVTEIANLIFDRVELIKMVERLRSMVKYDTMEVIVNSIAELLEERYEQPFGN